MFFCVFRRALRTLSASHPQDCLKLHNSYAFPRHTPAYSSLSPKCPLGESDFYRDIMHCCFLHPICTVDMQWPRPIHARWHSLCYAVHFIWNQPLGQETHNQEVHRLAHVQVRRACGGSKFTVFLQCFVIYLSNSVATRERNKRERTGTGRALHLPSCCQLYLSKNKLSFGRSLSGSRQNHLGRGVMPSLLERSDFFGAVFSDDIESFISTLRNSTSCSWSKLALLFFFLLSCMTVLKRLNHFQMKLWYVA